jgi:hypothetical protein
MQVMVRNPCSQELIQGAYFPGHLSYISLSVSATAHLGVCFHGIRERREQGLWRRRGRRGWFERLVVRL